jgi:tetratricopeptide (TPR) repeat protein
MLRDSEMLARIRSLRKRRSAYSSVTHASREIDLIRALLPERSIERAIFERCDVSGTPYKQVAEELNISDRQLYRFRRRMVQLISAGEPALFTTAVQRGNSLADVETLLKYGLTEQADAALRVLRSSGIRDEELPELLLVESRAATDKGCYDQAQTLIGEADYLIERFAAPSELRRRSALARSYLLYAQGRHEEATRIGEAAIETASTPLTESEAYGLGKDLTFIAMLHQEGSSPERAIELLKRAEALIRRCEGALGELAMIHVHRAFALAGLVGGLPEALAEAERALAVAQKNGAPYEIVWARLVRGSVYEMLNCSVDALTDMKLALTLGNAVLSGDPWVRTHFHAVRAELKDGLANAAVERLKHIRSACPAGSLHESHFLLVNAKLHYALRDFRSAYSFAEQTVQSFSRGAGSTHWYGTALLVRAKAGSSLGFDVASDLQHAMPLLRRGADVGYQLQGLELWKSVSRS